MESKYGGLAIFDVSPVEYQSFSDNVCNILNVEKGECLVEKFKDGETDIFIDESVRGKNVFVFQSYVPPIGERKYELELFMDAVGVGGCANRVNVVMPYLFGQRGDRQTRARQSVPASVVAKDLMNQASSVLCVDVHNKAIQTMYTELGIRFEHLEFNYVAAEVVLDYLVKESDIFLGSIDVGGIKRVRNLRDVIADYFRKKNENLILPIAAADKHRPKANVAEVNAIIGDVKDKDGFLIDDIGDTLNSSKNAARAYKDAGARKLYKLICHGVLSGEAEENLHEMLETGLIDAAYFGNTVPLKPFVKKFDNFKIVPLEPFVAEGIRRMHLDISISGLHQHEQVKELYTDIDLL